VSVFIVLIVLWCSAVSGASFSLAPYLSGLSSFGFPADLIDSSPAMTNSYIPDFNTSQFPSYFMQPMSGMSFLPVQNSFGSQMPASFNISDIMASSLVQPAQGSMSNWAPSATDNYGESSNGGTITIKLGDTIHLQLPARIDRGYIWNLTITDGLNITSERVYTPQQISSLFSGSGLSQLEVTQEWDIKAIKAGTQVILGSYKSSAANGTYDKTYELTVIVE
jgi:inhibitor of cysteine peptidase